MQLLGHYHFTPFLKEYGLFSRLQQHCKAAALRIGARLDDYYKSTNLGDCLGCLKFEIRDEFKHTKKCRQDTPPIKLPIPLHVHALNSSSFNFMRKFAAGDEEDGWEWAEQQQSGDSLAAAKAISAASEAMAILSTVGKPPKSKRSPGGARA